MFIHIGYAKAASSWTQRMFRTDGSGFYFPLDNNKTYIDDCIVEPDSLGFDPELSRTNLLSKYDATDQRVPVLSSERLAGNWFTGGYYRKEIANRLHTLFPDGKVLMIIREQKSMLSSVYRQYIRKGGVRTPRELFLPRENLPHGASGVPSGHGRGPKFSFDLYKYDRLIEHYNELFSPENVLVIPLEYLKTNTKHYVDKIVDFAEADPDDDFELITNKSNTGISFFDARLKRYFNPFIESDYINDYSLYNTPVTRTLSRGIVKLITEATPQSVQRSTATTFEQEIADTVGDRYRKSNRQTNELIDFDLAELGYDL